MLFWLTIVLFFENTKLAFMLVLFYTYFYNLPSDNGAHLLMQRTMIKESTHQSSTIVLILNFEHMLGVRSEEFARTTDSGK